MKVHAFKVNSHNSNPLEAVLEKISKQSNLRKRIKIVSKVEMRAEHVEFKDDLWLMDFVRIRTDHGPGKVGRDNQIEGIKFTEDEGFGEETAALYDPMTGYMLIQYNHFGVRAGSIEEYLSEYDSSKDNVYELLPKYDDDVERRLSQKGIKRKLAFTIDIGKMHGEDREAGTALSDAITIGRDTDSNKITLILSAGGSGEKSLSAKASAMLSSLMKLSKNNPELVKKLEVSGKTDKNGITEVLDLIGHRLTVEFDKLKIGADLRYPREERYNALIRARNGWKKMLVP